jgi:hypothetical protein
LVLTIKVSAASRVLFISKLGMGASVAALDVEKDMRLNKESVTATRGGKGWHQPC